MKIAAVLLGLGLAFGLAVAAWLGMTRDLDPAAAGRSDPTVYFNPSAGVEDRLHALEQAVAEERNARQLLEEELQVLYAEIDVLTEEREERQARSEERGEDIAEARNRFEERRAARSSTAGRTDLLVEAGFTPDRAAWIVQREAELQVEAMQARFEARRSGEPLDPFDTSINPERALREEIGDYEYEQYLTANDRPTSVRVGTVLDSSPGRVAGLQAGDEILSYDGQRVFNTFDLNRQTMQGEPGESVVVDITRDGAPMQIVMPRGPIGIYTRGPGGRGR